jgi:hypothetical protein
MKRDRLESYQWVKFFVHWGFLLGIIICVLFIQLFTFFVNLNGTPWIQFFIASFTLMILGTVLIAFAKFPAYRSGRFFTFGIKSIPEQLVKHYK